MPVFANLFKLILLNTLVYIIYIIYIYKNSLRGVEMGDVKDEEINLVDEGFEEVPQRKQNPNPGGVGGYGGSGDTSSVPAGPGQGGARPDFRIVQPDRDKNGNLVYVNVGAMWKNVSKNGNEFYTLRIGQLKLLVFANTR
jgi:hypothetical protein